MYSNDPRTPHIQIAVIVALAGLAIAALGIAVWQGALG